MSPTRRGTIMAGDEEGALIGGEVCREKRALYAGVAHNVCNLHKLWIT